MSESSPCRVRCAGVTVMAAPPEDPPFWVEANVEEQDTCRVLADRGLIREPRESYQRLVRDMEEGRPAKPGSVLVDGFYPVRLLAIVHDLELEPSWREDWVAAALDEIFRITEGRGLRAVAMPPLGTRHGRLPLPRFLYLLRAAVKGGVFEYLARIWLVSPRDLDCAVLKMLNDA